MEIALASRDMRLVIFAIFETKIVCPICHPHLIMSHEYTAVSCRSRIHKIQIES